MSKVVLASIVLLFVLSMQPIFANEGDVMAEKAMVAKEDAKLVEVGNKLCPVTGEKVGEMSKAIKYEFNGKIFNLCCAMCAKDFKKDPGKYSKIAEDEVAASAKNGS